MFFKINNFLKICFFKNCIKTKKPLITLFEIILLNKVNKENNEFFI